MLGLSVMDPTVQGILFLVATILFLVAALSHYQGRDHEGGYGGYGVSLVPLGLAFFSFVFMWNAFAAS